MGLIGFRGLKVWAAEGRADRVWGFRLQKPKPHPA